MVSGLSVGVDIGGTFTDLIMFDNGGEITSIKTLTTPADPVQGVMHALDQALLAVNATGADVDRFVHATTLPTNLVLQRTGAQVVYITTAGFGDMFSISKQFASGPDLFNLMYQRSPSLVPRDRVLEIDERMNAKGEVLRSLDMSAINTLLERIAILEPEGVAICLLHAYANPAHEIALANAIRVRFPDLYVAISSDIWPEIEEYERGVTTLLSAYIGPTLAGYLDRLSTQLHAIGVGSRVEIMQSNGGIMYTADAIRRAAYMIESGPAAGVVAARHLGEISAYPDLISFDMGGTTAKAGLIEDGVIRTTDQFRVGATTSAGGQGSGEPIKLPVIDIAEVGAGGGSIAWLDSGGFLKVGPMSASSDPGPACYGLGGLRPTVTDANLVLGYLSVDAPLGNGIVLDIEKSRQAVGQAIAVPMGLSVEQAAQGIVDLANAHMAAAINIVTIQRGVDPRRHALVVSGGAGPAHALRLAEYFNIPLVIVPPMSGVRSAVGLLVSDVVYDYAQTAFSSADHPDLTKLRQAFDHLTQLAAGDAASDHGAIFARSLDMHFSSQALHVPINLDEGALTEDLITAAEHRFRDQYQRLSGLRSEDSCEISACRLKVTRLSRKPEFSPAPVGDGDATRAHKGHRAAYFVESGGFTDTPIYDRARLQPGDTIAGPCLIEEMSTTTVCPPGFQLTVDRWRNLLLRRQE